MKKRTVETGNNFGILITAPWYCSRK